MIIITGGAGFIGSNLVAQLRKHTQEPLVVCDHFRQDERWQNLKHASLEDIVEPDDLFLYLDEHSEDVSLIFHLGARVSTTDTDADTVIDRNFKFTADLIKWCTMHQTRLIYASAASVYGDGSRGFDDTEEATALAALSPFNVYAWSKLLIDRFVAERRQRHQKAQALLASQNQSGAPAASQSQSQSPDHFLPPQCVGLRFFNVYGPNEYHKGDHVSVVKKIYDTIKFGNSARLFKSYKKSCPDGNQQRDFVWVGDCVDVMIWLYDNPGVSGLYNVGSGKARTFNDLAKASFTALNMPVRIDYVEMPKGLAEKYQYHTEAPLSRLRQAGYMKDFTPLEEGVRLYIQDYLRKDDPYL